MNPMMIVNPMAGMYGQMPMQQQYPYQQSYMQQPQYQQQQPQQQQQAAAPAAATGEYDPNVYAQWFVTPYLSFEMERMRCSVHVVRKAPHLSVLVQVQRLHRLLWAAARPRVPASRKRSSCRPLFCRSRC